MKLDEFIRNCTKDLPDGSEVEIKVYINHQTFPQDPDLNGIYVEQSGAGQNKLNIRFVK